MKPLYLLILVGMMLSGCAENCHVRGIQEGIIIGPLGVEATRAATGMELAGMFFLPPAWLATFVAHGGITYLLWAINPVAGGAYLGGSALYGAIRTDSECQ